MAEQTQTIALIGGTGLNQFPGLDILDKDTLDTPFGVPSAPLVRGTLDGMELLFLARHGPGHVIPPHRINYRANLWALREQGAGAVIAVAAVGGITAGMTPGRIVVPDQIVDYTWGRQHTFFEGGDSGVDHIDFTYPFHQELREVLIQSARQAEIDLAEGGVYGATQGPRLESAAEIRRLENDGCDVVGMTGMPEAALAREIGLDYAAINAVVNRAAGKGSTSIHAELEETTGRAMEHVRALIRSALPGLSKYGLDPMTTKTSSE